MPRRNESTFEALTQLPWWVSVVVACVMFILVKLIIPSMMKGSVLLGAAAQQISSYAIWVGIFFLIPGGISAIIAWRRGELLKGQTGISTIRNLSWRSLEDLVGEAYRRKGYSITGNSGPGADGGVDLVACKDGETVLIQCKQWKARRIGVKTVREMFGLLNSEKANEVHIVTSGSFTEEARGFARNKPMRLIDGPMLVQLVKLAQSDDGRTTQRVICPKCGSDMVLRKAIKGSNAGKQFWGCQHFPSCRGTRDISP